MPEIADLITPALVIGLFAWLRSDIVKLHDRLDATSKAMNERFDATSKAMNERFDATSKAMNERFDAVLREIGELRERMAKLEGSLEGFLAGRRDRDAA